MPVQCGTVTVLYSVTLYILVFDVSVCYVQQCFVFMGGTYKQVRLR